MKAKRVEVRICGSAGTPIFIHETNKGTISDSWLNAIGRAATHIQELADTGYDVTSLVITLQEVV